jgi:hypothetical protein
MALSSHITTTDGLLTSLWVGSAVCLFLRKRREPATDTTGALHDVAATNVRLARGIAYQVKKGSYAPDTALEDLSVLCLPTGDLVTALERYIASEEQ